MITRSAPLSLQVDVDTELADDIRVFLPKEQTNSDAARCSHARVLLFLQSLAAHIDNAAGYAHRPTHEQATKP